MDVHVRKMNDKHETVIDIKHVVAIRKRERTYSSSHQRPDYFVDVFLNTHPPFNKIELEYFEQAWRDKEYSGISGSMGFS